MQAHVDLRPANFLCKLNFRFYDAIYLHILDVVLIFILFSAHMSGVYLPVPSTQPSAKCHTVSVNRPDTIIFLNQKFFPGHICLMWQQKPSTSDGTNINRQALKVEINLPINHWAIVGEFHEWYLRLSATFLQSWTRVSSLKVDFQVDWERPDEDRTWTQTNAHWGVASGHPLTSSHSHYYYPAQHQIEWTPTMALKVKVNLPINRRVWSAVNLFTLTERLNLSLTMRNPIERKA